MNAPLTSMTAITRPFVLILLALTTVPVMKVIVATGQSVKV